MLIHGLETHRPPAGGRLRGEEFKQAVRKLRAINGQVESAEEPSKQESPPRQEPTAPTKITARNTPLLRSENEHARSLATLHEELVTEVDRMPPQVAAYFRERSDWLTPELMRKWGMGYLPRDGRSMFRGWVVYTHRDEQGEVLSYSGRDVGFDEKWRKWLGAGKPEGKKPAKHKYVKGYLRGQELYGQPATRLQEPHVAESLKRHGLVVCEGMNDVIRLDALGVAAVGITSNKATEEQIAKLVRFASGAAEGRVVLMLDTDEEGEAGAKQLLWRLSELRLDVRLGWSCTMHDAEHAGRQPEQLTTKDWQAIEHALG